MISLTSMSIPHGVYAKIEIPVIAPKHSLKHGKYCIFLVYLCIYMSKYAQAGSEIKKLWL